MREEKTFTLTYAVISKEVFTTSMGEQIARVTIEGPNRDTYMGGNYCSPVSQKINPEHALQLAEQNAIYEMLQGLHDEWFR